MKLIELFDGEAAPNPVEELAANHDFTFKKAKKSVNGQKHDVYFLTSEDDGIEYEYLVNRKTLGWLFRAGKSETSRRLDFETGYDLSTLEKHLKKKKKLSSKELEDIFDH